MECHPIRPFFRIHDLAVGPTLSPGTSQVAVVATDLANNTSTRNFQVTVASADVRSLVYDNNGNVTARYDSTNTSLSQLYAWDAANRLIKITYADLSTTEFAYDGLGRRVQEKRNGTVIKKWVWCDLEMGEEHDASNTVTKRFYPQGQRNGTANYFYTRDHLGSVREVTDSAGAVQVRYDYDPYGNLTILSGSGASDFCYTGHYYHALSGLHLAPYRTYDSNLGKWLSRDPIGEEGPDGPNLYTYVSNDPVNGVDPLGLWNLWNPLSYGLPSNPGENPWNPFDSSAEWGATGAGSKMGAAAYIDGINPFGNFYQDLGVYDPCKDKGTSASRWLGKYVGREALLTVVGAGVASKFSGPLSRLPLLGKGGPLFGRGGRFGLKGVLNSGDVRLGWGWNGVRDVFRASWSTPGNRSWWNHFDIF